jgi:hypothetical protein
MDGELERARLENPQWRVWCGEPFLYATKVGVLNPGQGCTVYGRTAAVLADEVAKAEALGDVLAAKRAQVAGHER